MKPVAYVSDENYLALAGVRGEFENTTDGSLYLLESSPRGAFYGDFPPGRYRVTLAATGFGAKRIDCQLHPEKPLQFRLLSDCLLGFMWPKWLCAGEQSEIRVHSTEPYQLTLWRYGYRKEFVRMLGWFDEHGPRATVQITPDGDYTQTGVQWNRHGYPAPHPQQLVTAPERSGLYYLWARTPSGRTFSFPWVVAPSRPKAQIAVLASTNTWNVYNNFGGRSNYINPRGLPKTPTVNARQDLSRYTEAASVWSIADDQFKPLSFERPEIGNDIFDNSPWCDATIADPIQGRMQCGQAPGEWRLAGWLEREGFEYDYYSEAQLHDGTLSLDAYKVLLIAVHPEYWTREMFNAVKAWVVERGGRLMYLGGNGLNCEVLLDLENHFVTCISHESPQSGFDSRMHRTHVSEASLLGVAFSEPGVMTAAPYRVLDAAHWLFAGTGLNNGDLFGEKSLHERVPGGASGHETDKITSSSPAGLRALARGANPDDGGAELVYFPLGAGAVFSVGSITWVSALFPDEHVSRITKNALVRMLS